MAAIGPASAQSTTRDEVEALKAQINALQQQLRALEKKVNSTEKASEKTHAAAVPVRKASALPVRTASAPPVNTGLDDHQAMPTDSAPPTAVAKMSPSFRPSICSSDGLNCIAITSRLHFDMGGYHYRPNTPFTSVQQLDDGVNARRARIGVLGTFMGDWKYALIYDFGGSSDGFSGTAPGSLPHGGTSGIENAYLSYVGIPGLAIEIGYMDLPYTLGEATSSNDTLFMERASSTEVAINIAAGDFRSTAGVRWYNDLFWAGANVTGPTSGAIHVWQSVTPPGMSEQLGGTTRAVWHVVNQPGFGIHIGGDAEALFKPSDNFVTGVKSLTLGDRPELRIDPTTILTTGPIANVTGAQVYSIEAAANYGPLLVQGEYYFYNVDRALGLPSLKFSGGYAEAGWVITGESRTYNGGKAAYFGVVPEHPFSWASGDWGAWEIAARYSMVNLNDRLGFPDGVAGGKQTIITAGLNWYVNRNIRFMLNYLHGKVDKEVSATNSTDAGSKFDALAMRSQVAF